MVQNLTDLLELLNQGIDVLYCCSCLCIVYVGAGEALLRLTGL